MRCQELCVSLALGFVGGGILTALFSMSLASRMYFWISLWSQTSRAGLARFSLTCRRKDVRRSSPGGDGAALCSVPGSQGSAQPMGGADGPELGSGKAGEGWHCSRPARGARSSRGRAELSVPAPCAKACTATAARIVSRAPGKETGLYSLCRAGPALRIRAKNSSRRHVHFGESRPAVSHREHLLLAAAPAECSPAFPGAQQLPMLPAPPVPSASSCRPLCPPWHHTCPQNSSAQPVSLGWARRDARCPPHAGSGQIQPAQSHPWGLMPVCDIPRAGPL